MKNDIATELEEERVFLGRRSRSLETRLSRHKKREEICLDGTAFKDRKGGIAAITPPAWETRSREPGRGKMLGVEDVNTSHLSPFLSSNPMEKLKYMSAQDKKKRKKKKKK